MLKNWDSWINGDEWGYDIVGHIYIYIFIHIGLVVLTPLKNMKVSWDDYSQYMEQ